MKKWVCTVCGWVYDEELGDPDYDLAPGVPFEDLPDDFVCPLCGGTGEVTVMEQVYPGEPHVAPIGTQKCICQLEDEEDNHE